MLVGHLLGTRLAKAIFLCSLGAVVWSGLPTMGASAHAAWNNPYPERDTADNILYSAFRERPKTFDPARSYSSNEYAFIAQIYEPPFQYHYLKRPYVLVPLTATRVPQPVYYDRNGRTLPADAPVSEIALSVYEIRIKPGVYYQPHPCFAENTEGQYRYLGLTQEQIARYRTIADFRYTSTRELVAADYVYQIKRLAHPKLHSPILSLMSEYIVGLRDYTTTLRLAYEQLTAARKQGVYLDLRNYALEGAEVVDRYTYRVKIRGTYPQFRYWMALPFFAPMPYEADRFYSQAGMAERNLTLDWYPVGSGPYMLTVNNPNLRMVLTRNPNFHAENYPDEGESGDAARGLLTDSGQRLPFIDKAIYSLEKETIPYWNKFLQGYYDQSSVAAESFDQAIQIGSGGEIGLTETMRSKGIRLLTSVAPSTYYLGFNMLDPVVGGYSERKRKLRQAISIAIDYEQYILIFLNSRGIPAQGPLPPGIFGHRPGCAGRNEYVYDCLDENLQRKPIEIARSLLAQAGYPDGRDVQSGKSLLLYFDTPATGPQEKAYIDWMRKQFRKLNIQLVARATDYNRFQEKMRKGDAQIFRWGWNADYPDPENFLFLLYGPNKKVGNNGENASNYESPEFDRLFERMKNMNNSPERTALIDLMLEIARRDAPWVWGLHPKRFTLHNAWVYNVAANNMANNTLKYIRLDPALRTANREEWNKPIVWPVTVLGIILVAGALPAVIVYMRKERQTQR